MRRIFAQISPNFPDFYSDFQRFCQIFRDFAQIFDKSKLLGVRLHPASYTTVAVS